MLRITRYVSFELLKVFSLALAGMTAMMLLFVLAKEALREGLGPVPILRLVPYVVPDALRFAVPGTMLFAACSVYGRMSAANEIVAIKSVGVSPMAVLRPGLILAFFVSLIGVWLNDVAVSWGRSGAERVVFQSIEEVTYGMLKTNHAYVGNRFSITVKRVEGRRLIAPTVKLLGDGSTPAIIFNADEAQLRYIVEQNELLFTMKNAEMDIGGKATITLPGVSSQPVPWEINSALSSSPSSLPLWKIPQECVQQKAVLQDLKLAYAAQASFELMSGDLSALTSDQWVVRDLTFQGAARRLTRLEIEPWRRWANGFSCFFFVLVGAPMAIRWRNADIWTTFGLVFLPVLLIYYPLLMFGVSGAKSGDLPAYAVWMGNVILCVIGLWYIRRVKNN
ncbi:MAG: permease [Blastopirellula sp.]|nr:permease [Blastopirellula sp.]